MIKVLQVVPNMQSGGLETFIMNVYRNIDREKVQFDFLVHYKEKKFYDNEIEKLGGKIYRFSLREDNNIFKYIKQLNNFFKIHKEYKIIHCHMASVGFLVFFIAKMNGVKVRIAHSHNSDTENTLKGIIKKILIKPYKFVSTVNFACSQLAGEFLFKKHKFIVVPNGIEIQKFKFDEKLRNKKRKELKVEDKFVVGHIGRFCEQKNHKFLLEVFKEVYAKNANAMLMLVGVGELEEKIKQQVKEFKLEQNVIFLGARKDVNELYQAMDVFAFPSKFEGLGIVLIEAQAAGLQVIASNMVPNEVVVTQNIKRIEFNRDKWVEEILNTREKNRLELENTINRFDIKTVSKFLQEYYENAI